MKNDVLQRALAPALVAADEFDQGRRVLLPAEILLRQHAHVVAGAPHQRGLDLVVAQHVAAQDAAAGQRRDRRNAAMNGATRMTALWPQ